MPSPETPSNDTHVPFRTCIRLEDESQARTSSIDDGWETLSVAPTQECTLPTVRARARCETLPGIGPASQPAAAPKPRRWRRSPLLLAALAATLSIGLAWVVAIAWRNGTGNFVPAALAQDIQPNRIAATSEPSPLPMSAPAAVVLPAEAPAPAGKAEPPAAPRKGKPAPRSIRPASRAPADNPAPRLAAVISDHARRGELASDNPY